MKTKLLLLVCVIISSGCKTQHANTSILPLIKEQQVDPQTEYAHGWNDALKNLEHHLVQKDSNR